MFKRLKKYLKYILIIVVVVGVFLVVKKYLPYLSGNGVAEGYAMTVARKDVASVIVTSCEIKAKVFEDYKSPSNATIKRLKVQVGQKVEANTPLVEMESLDTKLKMDTSMREMKTVQRTLAEMQEKYLTAVMMYKKDLASQETVLTLKKSLGIYKAETYADAKKKYDLATKEYQSLRLSANFSGYVTEIPRYEGDPVPKDETIMTITKLEDFYARFFISKTFRDKLKEGLKVKFYPESDTAGGNISGEGEIVLISQFISQKGIQVEVNFTPKDGQKEKYLNQTLRAVIQIDEHKSVMAIPLSSIYSDEKGYYVYIINDGMTERRDIKLGLIGEEYTEVISGLTQNDRFVSNPVEFLKPGLLFKSRKT